MRGGAEGLIVIVLQVIPELEAGGAERTVIEIAEAVTAAGGRCLVASRGGRLEGELEAAGGRLARLDMKSKNPWTVWRNAARLAALCEAEGVELIHVRSRAPAWSALLAARRANLPFVTTYHGSYNARSALKRLYNSVMARGDLVIANSEFIAARIHAEHGAGDGRIRVIPRGVDAAVFDPEEVDADRVSAVRARWGVAPDRPVILLPGRLTRWKGQAFMIEVLAKLEPPPVLVCAGDAQGREDYRRELIARAEKAGLTLVLPGHETDMAAACLAADLVVCPSLEPEAFGRTAAEAQAMGVPVIAADHGGAREAVAHGETGWLAPPGDIDAWRAAVAAALAAGREERGRMCEAARRRIAALYSKTALQESTLRVYRELLECRHD